jgi:ribulose-phosphate 3-epimerase
VKQICPTVLATTPEEYDRQIKVASSFAKRIQVDLMDGDFASPRSVELNRVWFPENKIIDVHLMYKKPMDYIDELIRLKPSMIIIHAEAEVDHLEFAKILSESNIKAGICLLADTKVADFGDKFKDFKHFLIFGGTLGSFGGKADLNLLSKSEEAKNINPDLEIGWDGGVNDEIAKSLAEGGVDVLNAGGYIQKAPDPKTAYERLVQEVE